MDRELIDEFVSEMKLLQVDLKRAIKMIIVSKMQEPRAYENYGQVIDRIYGTATTLGMMELGEYTKALKDISYMAANSDNMKGREKAGRMMIEGINLFERLVNSIYNKEELKKLNLF
jgi:chemotaxis protein histidine kinase CheA